MKKSKSNSKSLEKSVTSSLNDVSLHDEGVQSAVKRISAHDLFSLFTAEIIENPTVFVR